MTAAAIRHKGEMGGIHSTADLDSVVKIIGLCDVRLNQVNSNLKVEIDKLKTAALVQAQEVETERKTLLALAQTYVESNRAELLKDRKSLSLNFGKIGYRKKKDKFELPKKGTPEMEDLVKAIEKLAEIEPDPFAKIHVNIDKYILKGALSDLSDKDLLTIGLERTGGEDEFFIEPDKAKVSVPDEPRVAVG